MIRDKLRQYFKTTNIMGNMIEVVEMCKLYVGSKGCGVYVSR